MKDVFDSGYGQVCAQDTSAFGSAGKFGVAAIGNLDADGNGGDMTSGWDDWPMASQIERRLRAARRDVPPAQDSAEAAGRPEKGSDLPGAPALVSCRSSVLISDDAAAGGCSELGLGSFGERQWPVLSGRWSVRVSDGCRGLAFGGRLDCSSFRALRAR